MFARSSGQLMTLGLALVLALWLSAACGGGSSQEEQASEEENAKQEKAKKGEEKTTPSPFEGEHENLQSGDTSVWREGLELTISDVHLAPNQSRASAQKSRESQEKRGKEAKKSPAEEGPLQLVVFSWTVANNGQIPVNFGGSLPCEGLDPNGACSLPAGASLQSRAKRPKRDPLSSRWSRARSGRA